MGRIEQWAGVGRRAARWVGLLVLWLLALGGRAQAPELALTLKGAASSLADQTIIYLQADATTGFDADYDASKLPNSTGLNLGSITPDSLQLSINALPPAFFVATSAVGLTVGVPSGGQYTLSVSRLLNFGFANVYLADAELQTRQLLSAGSAYAFVQDSANTGGTYFTDTRFSLVFEPTGIAPLPVVLTAFATQPQGADGLLTWATASEQHNAYFQVESSLDGRTFTTLGRVAGAGTATTARAYQFVDYNLTRYAAPLVYYRLRQVDADGTGSYSPVRTLAVPTGAPLQLALVPGAASLALAITAAQPGPATCLLTDGLGRVVGQQEVLLRAGTTTLPPLGPAGLAAGLYVLRVQQGQQQQSLKLVR